jgi:hypothetical protein
MSRTDLTETGRDRAALARDAGFSRVSFVSVLAGVLVAYGAFAVLVAAAAAVAATIGVENTLTVNDWAQIGTGSAVIIALVVLLAYGFGGYVAGRMARRAGLLNGLGMFVLAVAIIAVLAALATAQADSSQVASNLRSLGIPTSGSEWGEVGTVAGLGTLAAMLLGAAFGGLLGERWHTKLTRRAATADTAAVQRDPDRDRVPDRDKDRDGVPDDREPAQAERDRPGAEPTRPAPVRSDRVRASTVLVDEEGRPAVGPAGATGEGRHATGTTTASTGGPGGEGRHVADRSGSGPASADARDTVVLDDAARHEEQERRLR